MRERRRQEPCSVCQDGTSDTGFRGIDRAECGGKSPKERRVLFRIRISKTDHGSAIFKSCTVLLLPTESINIMALLTHFFATRLQCYRSTFATAATAARHRCRVRTGCDGDDENRRPRKG